MSWITARELQRESDVLERLLDIVLVEEEGNSATAFFDKKNVVTVTGMHKRTKRDRQVSVVVTFGAPNYKQRRVLKLKQDGPPFTRIW